MKYAMLTTEVLDKMCKCFDSVQEIIDFCDTIENISAELIFLKKLRDHLPSDSEPSIRMKAITMLTLFVRDNIEILRNLIQVCEVTHLDEEKVKRMMDNARDKINDLNLDFLNDKPN